MNKNLLRSNVSGNKRVSSSRQRRQQHLLDVKVRSRKASQQRNRFLVSALCKVVLFTGIIAGAVYGVKRGLNHFLWENPEYVLREISVISDGGLSRGEILNIAGLEEGKNIFSVNLSNVHERLMKIPQIEKAELRRELPGKIFVTVSERKPVAWLAEKVEDDPTTTPNSFLIDDEGILIASDHRLESYLRLPIISGVDISNFRSGEHANNPGLDAALELLRINSTSPLSVRFQIRGVDLSSGYSMVVRDQTRSEITFGLDRISWQLKRLALLLQRVDQDKREIATANLMVERNVPVIFVQTAELLEESSGSKSKALPQVRKAQSLETPRTQKKMPVRKAIPLDQEDANG